ncbi:MAG: hypothetical protein F6K39_36290 [Okeania sp. SIO3B3]|nr:hypothetical protein [Okeania sp. SIO3B3]
MNNSDLIFYVATGNEDVEGIGDVVNNVTQNWLDGLVPTDYYLDCLAQNLDYPEIILKKYENALSAMINRYGRSF